MTGPTPSGTRTAPSAQAGSVRARLRRLPQGLLIGVVRGYRLLLSPWLGSSCRFEPTCSAYALGALESRGALEGSVLTLSRLVRCHPWCVGGQDPVPAVGTGLFTALLGRHRIADSAAGASAPAPACEPRKTSV